MIENSFQEQEEIDILIRLLAKDWADELAEERVEKRRGRGLPNIPIEDYQEVEHYQKFRDSDEIIPLFQRN